MERGKLRITIEGEEIEFYPYNSFDEVLQTVEDEEITLRTVLTGIDSAIALLQTSVALKADAADVYTKTQTYTKTEVNNALSGKANTATTIAGYGITNAYTKNEVDTRVNAKVNTQQGVGNAGKVLQVGPDGNVSLSSGGGHKIVGAIPNPEAAEDNVVYFVKDEGDSPASETSLAQLITNLQSEVFALTQKVEDNKRLYAHANFEIIKEGRFSSAAEATYDFTANRDGLWQVKVDTGSTGGLPFMRIIVDGTTVYEVSKYGNAGDNTYMYRWSPFIPIKQGSSLRFVLGVGKVSANANYLIRLY